MRDRSFGLAFLTAVVVGCGGATASAVPSSAPSVDPDKSTELVADLDVGGRTMHLVCVGPTDTGEPTVLLEAGGGMEYSAWSEVLSGMLARHRLCAYDRAGLGMSQAPTEATRTAADQVVDLRALLDAADVRGPFVIGAHSYGSYVATLFAQAYPGDLAGLVFVDPRAPRVSAGWRDALPTLAADEPASVSAFRNELETFETDPSLNDEHLDLETSGTQAVAALDAAGPLFGDRPVVVLSADRPTNGWSDLPRDLATTFGEIWFAGQQELADESTAGALKKVPNVGHSIHIEDPPVVIAALEEVLAEVTAR